MQLHGSGKESKSFHGARGRGPVGCGSQEGLPGGSDVLVDSGRKRVHRRRGGTGGALRRQRRQHADSHGQSEHTACRRGGSPCEVRGLTREGAGQEGHAGPGVTKSLDFPCRQWDGCQELILTSR